MENYSEIINSIRELTIRIENLENENKLLRGLLEKPCFKEKQNKISSFIQELPSPSILFNEWIEYLINNVESQLETVYSKDLLTGMVSLLKDSVDNFDSLPIIAFNRKPGIFYCYKDDENGWILLDNSEFNKILGRLDYWFLYKFNECWYKPNIQNIQKLEEYKNRYDAYYYNILGGDKMPTETRYNRTLQQFYKIIKQSIES